MSISNKRLTSVNLITVNVKTVILLRESRDINKKVMSLFWDKIILSKLLFCSFAEKSYHLTTSDFLVPEQIETTLNILLPIFISRKFNSCGESKISQSGVPTPKVGV